MVNVTAATSFFGTRTEGMWRAGDTRRVSAHRAHELIEEGLAIEARDQSEGAVSASPLSQVATAIGATVADSADASLPAVADALGAKVDESIAPVTLDSLKKKQEKHGRKTKEEKEPRETKDEA